MRVLKMGIGVLALTSVAMGCTGGSSSGSSSGTSGNNNNTSSSSSTGGGSSMGGGSSGIIGSSGGGNSSRMQSSGGGGSSSGGQASSNPIVERMTCLPDGAASSSSQGGNSSSTTVVSSSAGGASSVGGSSSGGGSCVDDNLPAHYSPAAAHVVTLTNNAASLTAMVSCPENEDWYKVAVPAGGGIKVDMAFMDATSDLDLYIYAESDPTLSLDSSTGTTDMEEVTIPVVDGAQNLLVRVRNYSRARNDYTINFTVTPGGICAMDGAGDNSTEANAEVLYSTSSNTRWILCPPAADYFSFTAPSAGTARVKAVFGTGQLSFILFTAGMEASPVATSAAVADGAEATFTATADTVYFVKVTAPTGATFTAATYKLQASGPAFCFDDLNEPNNDEAGATDLAGTDYGTLCSGDVDVFTFMTTAGTARVRILPTNPNSVDAAIQTAGGTVVTSTRMDVMDGFELSFTATAGTAYFVRLSNANGVEQSSYDIEVFAPPPANDTCATAIALTPTATGITVDGTTIGADATVALQNRQCTGYATPAGDVFYTVTIGPNQLLTVRLDSTDSTDLAVYLIDDCATRCCWAGADRASGGTQEVLQYRNITAAAQNLFLAVDGWTASSVDGFSMEVVLQ